MPGPAVGVDEATDTARLGADGVGVGSVIAGRSASSPAAEATGSRPSPVSDSEIAGVAVDVAVGGAGVFVGGTGVLVGGTRVFVGGSGVLVGGTAVAVGGMGVSGGSGSGVGVCVGTFGRGAGVCVGSGSGSGVGVCVGGFGRGVGVSVGGLGLGVGVWVAVGGFGFGVGVAVGGGGLSLPGQFGRRTEPTHGLFGGGGLMSGFGLPPGLVTGEGFTTAFCSTWSGRLSALARVTGTARPSASSTAPAASHSA
jgi:hypothetical protein